jgi:hypothetical protein
MDRQLRDGKVLSQWKSVKYLRPGGRHKAQKGQNLGQNMNQPWRRGAVDIESASRT